MIEKYKDGKIPDSINSEDRDSERRFHSWFNILPKGFEGFFKKLEFHHALNQLWVVINEANKYIEDSAPWKEKNDGKLSNILYTLAESLRLIAVYIFPFMPSAGEKIWKQLGIKGSIEKLIPANPQFKNWGGYHLSGTKIQKTGQLFPRIDLGRETTVKKTPVQKNQRII
jgi:methionyl-tRNA synthetase